MAYGPNFYGIRTPPFMPYEPFLLGVGVVFKLLKTIPELILGSNSRSESRNCFWKRAKYCFESTVSEEGNSLTSAATSLSSTKNYVRSLWHTFDRLRGCPRNV